MPVRSHDGDYEYIDEYLTVEQDEMECDDSDEEFPQTAKKRCVVCHDSNSPHFVFRCAKFLAMEPSRRLNTARDLNICRICLRQDCTGGNLECKYKSPCECGEYHHSLLHSAVGTALLNISTTSLKNNDKCPICGNKHEISGCDVFLRMTWSDRMEACQLMGLCRLCLQSKCVDKEKCVQRSCLKCGQLHHHLLHPDGDRKLVQAVMLPFDEAVRERESIYTELIAIETCFNDLLMRTLISERDYETLLNERDKLPNLRARFDAVQTSIEFYIGDPISCLDEAKWVEKFNETFIYISRRCAEIIESEVPSDWISWMSLNEKKSASISNRSKEQISRERKKAVEVIQPFQLFDSSAHFSGEIGNVSHGSPQSKRDCSGSALEIKWGNHDEIITDTDSNECEPDDIEMTDTIRASPQFDCLSLSRKNIELCEICSGQHLTEFCSSFLLRTIKDRIKIVRSLNLCGICLRGPSYCKKYDCPADYCGICTFRHHKKLHDRTILEEEKENKCFSCVLCGGLRVHDLAECVKFLALSPQRRLQKVFENNLCLICLRADCDVVYCKDETECGECIGPHHILLHQN